MLGLGQGARLFFWSCFAGAVPVLLRKISLFPFRLAAVSLVPALRAVFAPFIFGFPLPSRVLKSGGTGLPGW